MPFMVVTDFSRVPSLRYAAHGVLPSADGRAAIDVISLCYRAGRACQGPGGLRIGPWMRLLVVDSATRLGPDGRGARRGVRLARRRSTPRGSPRARACARSVLNDAGVGTAPARASRASAGSRRSASPACAVDYRERAHRRRRRHARARRRHARPTTSPRRTAACRATPAAQAAACLLENARARTARRGARRSARRARASATPAIARCGRSTRSSLAQPEDRRAIVVTGSHGGLLGGARRRRRARGRRVRRVLQRRGRRQGRRGLRAPAGARRARHRGAPRVSANTARIGDGRSTYETGVLSRVNDVARASSCKEGMTAREAVARLVGLG